MSFVAKARRIPISPYKMRLLANVIRGKNVKYALDWLATCSIRRAVPLQKMVASAAANAKNLNNLEAHDLMIKDIRVDEGPMFRYFKAGAMGRSNIYRKRSCHMSIVVDSLEKKGD